MRSVTARAEIHTNTRSRLFILVSSNS